MAATQNINQSEDKFTREKERNMIATENVNQNADKFTSEIET